MSGPVGARAESGVLGPSEVLPFFTIGYGRHTPSRLLATLKAHQVRVVVDVRIWPTRAAMGSFTRAKDDQRGIAGLLSREGIAYKWGAVGEPVVRAARHRRGRSPTNGCLRAPATS